jgi:hypothetical protein
MVYTVRSRFIAVYQPDLPAALDQSSTPVRRQSARRRSDSIVARPSN